MIDTDKYEGHTEGEWRVDDEDGVFISIKYGERPHDFVDMENKANAQLMADAPLLLAEVKRLRGLLNMIVEKALHEVNTQPNGDDSSYNTILNIAYEGVIE